MRPERLPFIQVGVGNRGSTVLSELLASHADRFEPLGLVDVVPEFVEAARRLPGLAEVPAYTSLAEALEAQPRAVAVFIVTPARYHGAMVRQALLAGRHVWVEKPLTYDYAEAVALAELARRMGRSVVVGNQYQYDPLERRLQQLVQNHQYGRPFLFTYIHHRHRPQMRAFTGEYPALWEQGVHALDSILAILGHPQLRTVYALGQRPPHSQYRSDTVTHVLTQFADGVQASLLVTFDSQRTDWEMRVECERAALLLRADGWQRQPIQVLAGEQVIETVGPAIDLDPAVGDPYAAFYTEIVHGRRAPTSIEVNLRTIEWIDAAVQSLRSGTVVRVP
jgi:predicted dehydrogenase